MSEQKHTPGPWFVRAGSFRITVETAPPESPGRYRGKLCTMTVCAGSAHMKRGLSDARLIAAAPDMATALAGLLRSYTALVNCGDCGSWDPETEAEVIAARAALAKASLPLNGGAS